MNLIADLYAHADTHESALSGQTQADIRWIGGIFLVIVVIWGIAALAAWAVSYFPRVADKGIRAVVITAIILTVIYLCHVVGIF